MRRQRKKDKSRELNPQKNGLVKSSRKQIKKLLKMPTTRPKKGEVLLAKLHTALIAIEVVLSSIQWYFADYTLVLSFQAGVTLPYFWCSVRIWIKLSNSRHPIVLNTVHPLKNGSYAQSRFQSHQPTCNTLQNQPSLQQN